MTNAQAAALCAAVYMTKTRLMNWQTAADEFYVWMEDKHPTTTIPPRGFTNRERESGNE